MVIFDRSSRPGPSDERAAAREAPPRDPRRARDDGIHRVHLAPESAFLIETVALPPGCDAFPHNHTVWSMVGILRGQVRETVFRPSPASTEEPFPGLREELPHTLDERDVSTIFPPADFHRITNLRDSVSVMLNVYGGDITTRKRARWDAEARGIVEFTSVNSMTGR